MIPWLFLVDAVGRKGNTKICGHDPGFSGTQVGGQLGMTKTALSSICCSGCCSGRSWWWEACDSACVSCEVWSLSVESGRIGGRLLLGGCVSSA